MTITHKIGMDLAARDIRPRIDAVQGDRLTRVLEITLYNSGAAFILPEGVSVMMRYRKPDRTGGSYDTLPDGAQAWSAEHNVLTITLAPQMLTVSGRVEAQAEIILGESSIGTFSFWLMVEEDPSLGAVESEDYVNWLSWMNGKLDEKLAQARDSGDFVPVLTMGSVTLLPAGSQPTASIEGTRYPVLRLGIPDGVIGAAESTEYAGCYYRVVDGETEWLNPPAVLGVWYRTAERYLEKPVYVYHFEAFDNDRVDLSEIIEDLGQIIACGGISSNGLVLPYTVDEPVYSIGVNGPVVYTTISDPTVPVGMASLWVKYTKV